MIEQKKLVEKVFRYNKSKIPAHELFNIWKASDGSYQFFFEMEVAEQSRILKKEPDEKIIQDAERRAEFLAALHNEAKTHRPAIVELGRKRVLEAVWRSNLSVAELKDFLKEILIKLE